MPKNMTFAILKATSETERETFLTLFLPAAERTTNNRLTTMKTNPKSENRSPRQSQNPNAVGGGCGRLRLHNDLSLHDRLAATNHQTNRSDAYLRFMKRLQ